VTRAPAGDTAGSYEFGPFVLIPGRQLLLQGGMPVRIGSRALDLLVALVERPGEVVGKRQLMTRVWQDVVVDEGNLKVNMAALRRTLGDGAGLPQYIATVTGRGYRFVAPVVASGAPGSPLASPTAGKRSHNLPTGTTRIFGRAEAIEAIRHEFDGARLVSIVGAGGIGKTTVALAVAEQLLGSFRDGVWLVDLALVKEASLAPNAIATAIGLTAHSASMLAPLCDFLRERDMLLVIDNCEHVIDAAASCVDRIMAEAAGVKILVTSREPLLVKGERVRRLAGLGAPPPSAALSAEEALTFPAIQLFVDRATARLESFRLADADASTVAEICRRLDGLALAIEFAATRVDAFAVADLLRQLDDRFSLLVGRRAGPERQRTLTATLDWSYSLLPPDEAALLRSVSVFAGAFDIAGGAAVSSRSATETAEALAQLAAKSLLATDLDADGIAYRLLETTKSYCLERLRASGEEPAIRQAHAEHICRTLERGAGEWALRPAEEWGRTYGRFIDDLRGALAWTGRDATNRSLRIRMTVAALLLWNHFSLTEESRVHVFQAVEDLEAAGLTGTALEMKLQLWLGGATMFTRGIKAQAIAASRRALEIATRIGDADYHLRCLMMIGIYELFTGEHEAWLRTLEDFVRVAGKDDPSILPEGDVHTGIAELFLGRLPSARRRLESLQARDLRYFGSYVVRYLSDPIVLVRSVLTQVQWLTGCADTATGMAHAAVQRAHELSHHLSLNNALSYVCPVFYWSGQYDECDRHVAALEEHVTRHGLVARRPVATFYRAALAHARGEASGDVVGALRRAIEGFHDINHLARMPYYLSVLADALTRCGRLDEADSTIRTALEMAVAHNEGWCLPEVLRVQASLRAAQHQVDEAEALLGKSMALARAAGALAWRLRSANDLARLWADRSKGDEARRMLRTVYDEFTEGFATQDLVVAADFIGSPGRQRSTARSGR
jgi:predicted ATPase/DNA-binding winged helix-turn-helix (wHTH) protein